MQKTPQSWNQRLASHGKKVHYCMEVVKYLRWQKSRNKKTLTLVYWLVKIIIRHNELAC